MPLEDDELFKDRPRAPRQGSSAHERKPYHEMSEEERRAAWAELREAQSRRARRSRMSPFLWGAAAVGAFVASAVFAGMGERSLSAIARWIGVALLAFTVVALGRGLIGRGSGKKDDFAPPGF
jgi:hypothetical protein